MPSRDTQKLLIPNNYVFVEPPRAARVPFMTSERDMWSWFSHPLLREGWIPRLAPRLAYGASYSPSRRSIPLRRADLTPADDCTHMCICTYTHTHTHTHIYTQHAHIIGRRAEYSGIIGQNGLPASLSSLRIYSAAIPPPFDISII